MKRFFWSVLILLDVGIIAASAFLLYLHWTHKSFSTWGVSAPMMRREASPQPPTPLGAKTLVPAAAVGTSTAAPAAMKPAAANPSAEVSHELFSYHNPKAQQVFIRGDFTGWKAEPMHKDAKGVWEYQANLTPGEYGYCYSVNDRIFPDPANKRTKLVGKTPVSSIVVKARP